MKKEMSVLSRIMVITGMVLLLISLFVPLWRIELAAPQYPEGLVLQIFPSKIGGDVEIINGLNHYIGMQTLHEENFIEFTILPYIISAYVVLLLFTAIRNTRRMLNTAFVLFVLFGVVAMADFWRWEYNYGHNLDPNAAIIVPGMAYQPPLIGFKQLLNFGAYSIPDTGGWMFLACGVLLLAAVIHEFRLRRVPAVAVAAVFMLILPSSCGSKGPEPIVQGKEECNFCKMTISDLRFATEAVSTKGRVYKFDDIHCMFSFIQEKKGYEFRNIYVSDFKNSQLTDAGGAFYVVSEKIESPMGGKTAAFTGKSDADQMAGEVQATVLNWSQLQ